MKRPYADPDCPKCQGEGWIYAKSMITLPGEVGGRDCDCVIDHHRRVNMERIWPSLSKVKDVPGLRERAPLLSLVKRDLWITAKESTFRKHLKAICYRKSHLWDAKVWSDKDIVKAWLNTAYAQGHKIYDTELDNVRVTAMYIDELVESYELVVFVLGVKEAANKETPSVLLEAIKTRRHLGRPSWVVDQPQRPLMTPDHRAYSEALEGMLNHWPHLLLMGTSVRVMAGDTEEPVHPVSDVDPTELIEEEIEGEEEIDEALSDLGEGDGEGDDEGEDDGEDDDEGEGEDDEGDGDEGDGDEGDGDEGDGEGDGEGEDDEGEDDEGEDDEGEDDEGEDDEGEDDEGEDDDEPTSGGTRNFLKQMAENEEVQEEQARKKAYRQRGKPQKKKGWGR